jgi:GNAT superfamily N-acetyltransferase
MALTVQQVTRMSLVPAGDGARRSTILIIRPNGTTGHARTSGIEAGISMEPGQATEGIASRVDRLTFRDARRSDVPVIVGLLADDTLGSTREAMFDPLPSSYTSAFEDIERDPRNELVVAEDAGTVVGVLQVTYIPGLTYQGGERAQIEGVRVAASHRGRGVGREMIERAIERARIRGCRLVQLTTDKRRPDAHRFYESLGFVASHEGMKLRL